MQRRNKLDSRLSQELRPLFFIKGLLTPSHGEVLLFGLDRTEGVGLMRQPGGQDSNTTLSESLTTSQQEEGKKK